MSTVKFTVPHGKFQGVFDDIKKSGVRYYPIYRTYNGWRFEIDEHPLVSFLILKYDLNTLN